MAGTACRTSPIRWLLTRWRTVLVGCAVAVLATAGTASAAPSPAPLPAPRLAYDEELAAQALGRQFHIPLAEARARIRRQKDVGELSELLPQQLGAAYAGTYIDNARQGRAVVLMTAAAPTAAMAGVRSLAAARGLPAGLVDIRRVRYGLAELSSVNRGIGDGLAQLDKGSAAPLSAWLDVAANRVVIGVPTGGATTTAQESFIAASRARYGDAVARGTYAGPAVAAACSWPRCDPPLRGGLWISAGGYDKAGYCTSGFNARSRTDGKWYLVTAGHCDREHLGVEWYEKFASDGWHKIGPVHRSVWDSRGDAAIIQMNNPLGWSPEGTVYVRQSGGYHPTTEDPEYTITRVGGHGDIPLSGNPPGYYVCHTGATWGTACGAVTHVGVTLTYDGVTVQNLGQVDDMAVCQGDSGGPIYVSHTGFGIFVALHLTSATKVGPNGYVQKCGVTAYYQGLNGLQDLLNVDIVLS